MTNNNSFSRWSGAELADRQIDIITDNKSSTLSMDKESTEHQFVETSLKPKL